MDQLSTRITTAFICHPNAKAILREIDVAMARCGFLPASSPGDGDLLIQLVAGSGMWHLMRMTPMSALWTVMDPRGAPFFQLLGKQLAAPGFAVISEEGLDGEVFFELDAQGNLRASGSWGGGERLGEVRLSQPIQPFSSGLRSLWNQGGSQAAVDGLDQLTPAQAFLRLAIKRLGGEALAQSPDWANVQRMEGWFTKASEAEAAAFLARKEQEREDERQAAAAKQTAAAAAAAEAATARAQAEQAAAEEKARAEAQSAFGDLEAPSLLQADTVLPAEAAQEPNAAMEPSAAAPDWAEARAVRDAELAAAAPAAQMQPAEPEAELPVAELSPAEPQAISPAAHETAPETAEAETVPAAAETAEAAPESVPAAVEIEEAAPASALFTAPEVAQHVDTHLTDAPMTSVFGDAQATQSQTARSTRLSELSSGHAQTGPSSVMPDAAVAASAPAEPAEPAAPSEPSYADGQRIEVGDAVAIDDGFSGGRLQAVSLDAAAPGGFSVALDVGGGRLQGFDGESFVQRAQRLGLDTLSYHAADGRVVDWLQARTAEGEARAQLYLGIRLLQGTGIDKDPKKAYEYLVLAADQNEALAQYLVAMMSKNPTRSARYWTLAAGQGHAPSQFCMGVAHVQGSGVPRDLKVARDWFERAAGQSHVPALYNLGVLDHKPETPILQDPDTKLPRLQQMCEEGDEVAAWVLGQLALQAGSGLDVDQAALDVMTVAGGGFEPAWRTLVSLLVSNRLSDHVRELVELGLSQAPDGPAADLGKGLIYTADGHESPELAVGVRYLLSAAEAGELKAKERLQSLQVQLLAHAPELVDLAQISAAEPGNPLVALLGANAQALQAMGESKLVPLGPNGRMQTLALWGAAAKLGDDEARQALEALQADPRWAQVQVLGDLARHTVSQTESLAPVDAVDSGIWGMLKTEPETARQSLDTGIDSHLPDEAEAKLLNELLAKPEGKDFEASLNSEDLAVLGAFKDLPPLDSLSAEPAPEAAAGEAHAAADASAEQASVADELATAEADAAAADAQLPAVFAPEPPPKRKPWWKFWAR